jgi:glycosyltransferase involved in cell wall biosynthesis
MTRIVHVIAEFSAKEAMGRTIAETASRVPGEHHLVAARIHDGAELFASVVEVGGAMETFPMGRSTQLRDALRGLRPDVVHLHGGALAPLLAAGSPIREHAHVMTMYAWPRVPPLRQLRAGGLRPAWQSNVLRPRVGATTVLPPAAVRAALRRAGTSAVLTPDPAVSRRLSHGLDIPVLRLTSGAPEDDRRATFEAEKPVIVFAGRAESVRGVDTLIDAFPRVLEHVPGARLKLLLIPRPELGSLVERVAAAGISDRVTVVTDPVPDLLAELAGAQVGAWPFKFDYTTSPPAMAIAEALSVGLPTVATEVGCVRAVVEPDVNGLTVPPGDAPALATALLRLLTDRDLWQRLATAGPATTRQLSWSRAAEVTDAAYRTALGPSAT